MVIGAITAGASDISFNLYGYVLTLFANVATAAYIVLIKHYAVSLNLDVFGMLLYNSILSFPFLSIISFVHGDFSRIQEFEYLGNQWFWLVFSCSCALGFVINYAVFLNTAMNSPLTQTVSGQFKDILILALGIIIFKDVHYESQNAIGIGLSLLGSVLYGVFKYRGLQAKTQSAIANLPKPQEYQPVKKNEMEIPLEKQETGLEC